jgi:integrase
MIQKLTHMIQKQILNNRRKVGTLFSHTYRSFLNETGTPIDVQQKLMRHSNIATTMDGYTNATLRAKQQANSKVVQMVTSQSQPQIAGQPAGA